MRTIALVVLMITMPMRGQTADMPAAIDSLVRTEIKPLGLPGAVIAVVGDGRVVSVRAYGTANIATSEPLTPKHLFRIASLTKTLVAAAVMHLIALDKVRPDAPLGTYIPQLDPAIARITPQQLLTHTSGLADYYGDEPNEDAGALRRDVESWNLSTPLMPPGTFSYANRNFNLAGRLIEAVHGKPFPDSMRDLVFQPLGMKDATFRPGPTRVAQGHETVAGSLVVSAVVNGDSRHWPAAGLYVSGEDIARFAVAFVQARNPKDRRGSKGAHWARSFDPCVPYPATPKDDSFCPGYVLNTTRGTDLVKYGGSGKGYASSLRIAPKHRAAVIVLANANRGSLNPIAENILEMVIGMRLSPASVPRGPASIERNTLVGEYRNDKSHARIRSDGRAQLEAGAWEALEHIGDDCYRAGGETICFSQHRDRVIMYWRERGLVRTNP